MIKRINSYGLSVLKQISFYTQRNRRLSSSGSLSLILYFHRIVPPAHTFMDRIGTLEPAGFQKVICYLGSLGYQFVTLEDLVKTLPNPSSNKLAVITFDDGYADLYVHAYPFLKEKGIPFTLFLITSTLCSGSLLWLHKLYLLLEKMDLARRMAFLGRYVKVDNHGRSADPLLKELMHNADREIILRLITDLAGEVHWSPEEEQERANQLYLTPSQLLEMKANGLQIEAHGHEHWPLHYLNREETEREVYQSVNKIQDLFSRRPRFYSIPYGRENKHIIPILQEAGFTGSCCIGDRPVGPNEDPFHLPRVKHLRNLIDFSWQLTKFYKNTEAKKNRS